MSYADFLKNKIRLAPVSGLQVDAADLNPILKPHQRDMVVWAVRGGKRAIFAAFGLGKSVIQIEILRLITKIGGGRALIVLPLGVRQEFRRDGEMLGVDIRFIRRIEEAGDTGIYMTNYETVRDGKLDPNAFDAVSLDEASVLRSYGSKTYQTFLSLFDGVRYRFVATATPSPNRYKELIHYAGFLGIMDTGQALTRFFQRDSTQANNLTLYPHKEREFWLWLNSWAIFLQRPSDLGYSDEGYDLPPFKVIYHEVQSNIADGGVDRDGQAALFRDTAVGVVSASREKRDTLEARIGKMTEILAAAPDDHFIIWHDLEDERRAIEKAVPSAVSIYGTQDIDAREDAIVDFSDGKFQYLAAKPVIAGSGCNFQRHCHKAVFLGIGFKFNDFIQALHRIYRFLQTHQVEIHIIYAESEREVLRTLQGKWEAHNRMVDNMSEIIREHGLDKLSAAEVLTRTIGVARIEAKGEGWLVANNDCVEETRSMADNSVDLIVTSIPFSNHYEYTPSYNDFGHTDSDAHFFEQMDFLTPELLRILKPGRVYACHTKDRILFGNVTGMGMPTVNPFHARTLFHTMQHGFAYMGMITVNTDVVRENNQTYRLGWTENCKDGTKMGVGSPEYILLFRKLPSDTSKAYADERVSKDKEDYTRARWQVDAHAFWRSSGDRLLTPDELAAIGPDMLAKAFTEWTLKNVYDYETHIRIGEALEARGALPSTFMSLAPGAHDAFTWHDVNRMRTLNGDQTKKGLENHICPLQFDIVDRLIKRFSNEGELVFDPFGGLFTVPYRALKLGRRGRASELNPGYFLDGIKYLQAMEREISTPTMFDIFAQGEGVAA
ncbi:DNA methyltransferase [Rhizobium bangladeshense]|uniref:DNA methyltransferase n=1 Tax=Rhizobium bangladeshense TaxID=1138189 RepID=UPI001C83886C|nr:DNA methyltransferase [Rhizobium bangladeshense]MBX4889799.1 DNA methylase N-4 [Rhizobium bangladeshense]